MFLMNYLDFDQRMLGLPPKIPSPLRSRFVAGETALHVQNFQPYHSDNLRNAHTSLTLKVTGIVRRLSLLFPTYNQDFSLST